MKDLDVNSMYYKNKISAHLINFMKEYNIDINQFPKEVRNKSDLIDWLKELGFDNANDIVNSALSFAFDQKYYNYYQNETDIRDINDQWIFDFYQIIKKLNIYNQLGDMNVIDIGCNNGRQINKLNLLCKKLYLVDIGKRALKDAKKTFPNATTIKNSADNLIDVKSSIMDMYISFRTYNSSYFSISKAVAEMSRILRDNAQFILSLPNGFLKSDGHISKGLLIPKTNILDEQYVYRLASKIITNAHQFGFENVEIYDSFYEVFVYGSRNEKSIKLSRK